MCVFAFQLVSNCIARPFFKPGKVVEMGDVHGGLLKCVLQLAACSDKVRCAEL